MNIAEAAAIAAFCGSGGGGGGGEGGVPTCNVTLIPKLNGEIVSGPYTLWSISGECLLLPNVYGQNIYQGSVPDSSEEFDFPIQIFNPGTYKINELNVGTENVFTMWDFSEPIIEGSATWDAQNSELKITGDCTITYNVYLD